MYKNRTIIGIIGKTCSGKSFVCGLFDQLKTAIFEIDEHLKKCPISYKERKDMIKIYGLQYCELETLPWIFKELREFVNNTDPDKVIFIVGPQVKSYLSSICDNIIDISASQSQRMKYAKKKGWTKKKFNYIDSLQKEI